MNPDDRRVLFREYVLDAQGDEDSRLRAVLEQACPDCAAELAAAEAALAQLALDVRPVAPRPELRARVLNRITAEQQGATMPSATLSPPLRSTPGAWRAPVSASMPSPRAGRPWVGFASAAALVAVVLVGGWWMVDRQERQFAALTTRLDGLAVAQAPAPGARLTLSTLRGTQGSAEVLRDRVQQRWLIAAHGLPATRAQRTYQLWLVAADGRVAPASLFTVAADGQAELTLTAPAGVEITRMLVTDEPAGGSTQPGSTVLLAGDL